MEADSWTDRTSNIFRYTNHLLSKIPTARFQRDYDEEFDEFGRKKKKKGEVR